jgi:O-acetyl-ADP-ribose deacetylase (regulator of RNase III)
MIYKEVQRDMMQSPIDYVFAHNIDAGETAMGAGVALVLCRAFPGLRHHCQTFASEHNHEVGHTCRYVSDTGRVVYNMYTKPHVWNSVIRGMTTEQYHNNQRKCLENLKQQMIANGETKLVMPKIASGLDRCVWSEIREIIHEVFEDSDIEIVICYI